MDTFKGFVTRIRYRKEETGYTIFYIEYEGDEMPCVGNVPSISEGECVEVVGEVVEHPMYGLQVKIQSCNPVAPDDPESLKRYLGSGAIKGVGVALAERIVKAFGDDTMRILEEEPERLSEVKGISERKAREIAIQFRDKNEARAAFLFLQQYGISNNMSIRIYEEYGDAIYSIMRENPYRLAEDIRGIGFKAADEIAIKAGIEIDSQFRIKSGLLYTLMEASYEGHMYVPRNILLQKTAKLLDLPEIGIDVEIDNLAMDRKVVIKNKEDEEFPQVYAYPNYYAELHCAAMLRDLNLHLEKEEMEEDSKAIQGRISLIESNLDIQLDELQRKAIVYAMTNGILILSGGPGTGKTTTINAMINYFESQGLGFLLAAPTGRAAKRMTEATGYESKTIHRLLELNGVPDDERTRARFDRNEDNPLEADVVIIDEMSMVDIFLFQALLKAIVPGTRLILVGDVDQLPSVGAGQVLNDLIRSGAFPVVVLEKIFRQEETSDIISNAHRIRLGDMPVLDNKSRDFFFLPRTDINVIYKHMVTLIMEKLPKYVDASPNEIQVLTPMRKGSLGVEALNSVLQDFINPTDGQKKEIEFGSTIFRESDKVMQIKNNYQLEWVITGKHNIPIETGTGVFNGDMGVIYEIDEYAKTVVVVFDDVKKVEYSYSQLEELELAYAVTIHKSQGSEYPAVIIPLMGGPRQLFNRNLLYTGVTRAKKCVTILGNEDALREMVNNYRSNVRYTGLKERIEELY